MGSGGPTAQTRREGNFVRRSLFWASASGRSDGGCTIRRLCRRPRSCDAPSLISEFGYSNRKGPLGWEQSIVHFELYRPRPDMKTLHQLLGPNRTACDMDTLGSLQLCCILKAICSKGHPGTGSSGEASSTCPTRNGATRATPRLLIRRVSTPLVIWVRGCLQMYPLSRRTLSTIDRGLITALGNSDFEVWPDPDAHRR
ncbi:hypothetical protein BDM02DRAFT_712407 [Thelephora ganbajun]|uniref:Uncharacterized protein n=1 Tax=Thelephora ganbajun TaxID=370292 RepID=A0ACB6Z6B1_THEGA|nr:hypothetical protein BDM02DRAFT_712407 [Thelephora ganbajun]